MGGNSGGGGGDDSTSAGAGGVGGAPDTGESLCTPILNGEELTYDVSGGQTAYYAGFLAMSCETGGFLEPLIAEDPVDLTAVTAFTLKLTDWMRVHILKCPDETSELSADVFALLPATESNQVSKADVDTAIALYLIGLNVDQTALTPEQRQMIERRLKSVGAKAVTTSSDALTHPSSLTPPDCQTLDQAQHPEQ